MCRAPRRRDAPSFPNVFSPVRHDGRTFVPLRRTVPPPLVGCTQLGPRIASRPAPATPRPRSSPQTGVRDSVLGPATPPGPVAPLGPRFSDPSTLSRARRSGLRTLPSPALGARYSRSISGRLSCAGAKRRFSGETDDAPPSEASRTLVSTPPHRPRRSPATDSPDSRTCPRTHDPPGRLSRTPRRPESSLAHAGPPDRDPRR